MFMKICHFLHENREYWGALRDGRVYPFQDSESPETFEFSDSKTSIEIGAVE